MTVDMHKTSGKLVNDVFHLGHTISHDNISHDNVMFGVDVDLCMNYVYSIIIY